MSYLLEEILEELEDLSKQNEEEFSRIMQKFNQEVMTQEELIEIKKEILKLKT